MLWLPSGNLAQCQQFEGEGQIRPVWFEIGPRVQITQVCACWYHQVGASRIMVFEVWDSRDRYSLRFDTKEQSWSVGKAVFE